MIDVERLLAELGISAKRQGPEYWALCPFGTHDDRKPSWSILDSPGDAHHGHHRCFSCSEGGGPVSLVRRMLNLSGPGGGDLAREWIAKRGIDGGPGAGLLPTSIDLEMRVAAPAFRMPPGVVDEPLGLWPEAARAYLSERGISEYQVERWGLCHAVDGRLAGRIVVPIADGSGRVESYTARTYVGERLRYLTPRTEDGANPAAIFGRRYWPRPGDRFSLVVTEGAFDALACERAGAPYVGAIGGGAAIQSSRGHAELAPSVVAELGTWSRLIIATDPDEAGEKFARLMHEALGAHVECWRARWRTSGDAAKIPEDELRAALEP